MTLATADPSTLLGGGAFGLIVAVAGYTYAVLHRAESREARLLRGYQRRIRNLETEVRYLQRVTYAFADGRPLLDRHPDELPESEEIPE